MTAIEPGYAGSAAIPRNGLGDLRSMLLARPCTVAYLGASVTAQKEGYRSMLDQWFTETFRQPHIAINAGFGGVGSISGVFMMDEQVIAKRPDLCLIEYSTGDMGAQTSLGEIAGAVEGMVLKLLDAGCHTCFLYLYRRDEELNDAHPVIAEYERVAAHYGIPSLHIGQLIQNEIVAGRFSAAAVVRDKVHTTPEGSRITTDCIAAGLQVVFEASDEDMACAPRDFSKIPLLVRNYHHTRIVPANISMLRDPQNCATGRFRFAYDYIRIDEKNEIRFEVAGELVGLLVIVGKDAGIIRVETAESTEEYTLWDEWCSYSRLTTVILRRPLGSGTSVRISLTDQVVDYAASGVEQDSVIRVVKQLNLVGFMVRGGSV